MAEPVKVVELITELASGGAQQTLLTLATGIDRSRFDLHVVCLFNGDGRVGDALRAQGLPVTDLGMRSSAQVGALASFYRLLRRERPAILHGWLFHANMIAKGAGRLARVPVVITSRHSIEVGGERREAWQARTTWMDDAVITIGGAVREAEITRSGAPPEKVHTIYNNVRVQEFADPYSTRRRKTRQALGIDDETLLIGSVGRMHPVKGFDVLIDAYAEARTRLPQSLLVLAGDGDIRPELEQRAARWGLAGSVRFLGDRRDVPDLLAAFDLFVLASRWEGIPVVVLEAMAAQRPVVATAAGGTTEVVIDEQTGLLAPVDDAQALADAIVRLAEDETLRVRLVQAAAARVRERFSADQAVAEYERIYTDLLAAKGIAAPPATPDAALRKGK